MKSLKIEFKERLEKEFLKSFPKFTSPNFVEKILLEENMKVVSMLHTLVTSVESDLLEDLSHSLVILFESMGKSNQLLQFMIHCEVATSKRKKKFHLFLKKILFFRGHESFISNRYFMYKSIKNIFQ